MRPILVRSPKNSKRPGIVPSLIPIFVLCCGLLFNVWAFHEKAVYGPNQIIIFLSSFVAMLIGIFHLKVSFEQIERNIIQSIGTSLQAILILLTVGALIGSWIISGIVPAMVFYGLKFLTPTTFLPLTCLICALVSTILGSSWPTTGTVGVAFMGVGMALGLPPGLVAGSILSGAYFGDKMSALSDSTNLAVAMVEVNLISHIRYCLRTSIPAFLLTLSLFAIIGLLYGHPHFSLTEVDELLHVTKKTFAIGPHLFIVPILVLFMVFKRVPALLALLTGTFLGFMAALLFQQDFLLSQKIATTPFGLYKEFIETAFKGVTISTGHPLIDNLFSRGGMEEMLNTIWIVLSSMVFTGTMEETGMLGSITEKILQKVKSYFGLVVATLSSSTIVNMIACDQFLSIVIPSKMFKRTYQTRGLDSRNLSRTIVDSGTVVSCLIPWNSCGAYHSAILGVSTLVYFPFCFFSFLSPLMTLIFALWGKDIIYLDEDQKLNDLNEKLNFHEEQLRPHFSLLSADERA